jgi:hypothetical protein
MSKLPLEHFRRITLLPESLSSLLRIPWLRLLLKITANLQYLLGDLGKADLKLTPNRVAKLINGAPYSNLTYTKTDLDIYASLNKELVPDILKEFDGKL